METTGTFADLSPRWASYVRSVHADGLAYLPGGSYSQRAAHAGNALTGLSSDMTSRKTEPSRTDIHVLAALARATPTDHAESFWTVRYPEGEQTPEWGSSLMVSARRVVDSILTEMDQRAIADLVFLIGEERVTVALTEITERYHHPSAV